MATDPHEKRRIQKRVEDFDGNSITNHLLTSSFDYYDVLYGYLESSNFNESKRVGSAEVVPPLSVNHGKFQFQTTRELALLPTTAILGYIATDVDSNGEKTFRSWADESYTDSAGLLLGIHHFNNGIGSVVRELEGIDNTCNIRLTTSIFDSESSKITAVDIFMDALLKHPNRRPSAIFGAYRSSVSVPLAILSGVYDVPQLNYRSTSTDLNDREQFRLFTRTIPTDAGTARAAVDYFRSRFKLTHIGILFTNDSYGGAFNQAFKEHASNRPIQDRIVVKSFAFSDSNDDDKTKRDFKFVLSQMKESGFRVFFGVFYKEHYEDIMTEAYGLGIVGPGYVWIVGDGISEAFLHGRRFPKGSPLAIATQGLGILKAYGGLSSSFSHPTTTYDRFINAWNNQSDAAISYYNEKQPDNNTLQNAQLYYKAKSGFFQSQSPTSTAVFSYDTVIGLGLAACRLQSSQSKHTHFDGQTLYDEFLRSDFEGASGNIQIDPDNGSRDPLSALFVLLNANGTQIIGDDDDDNDDIEFSISIVSRTIENNNASSSSDTMISWQDLKHKAFVYSDGTTQHPPTLPPIQNLNLNQLNNVRYGGWVFASIIFIFSIFFAIWICWNREVRVVKSAQPIFLIMICWGTFIMGVSIITLSIDDRIFSIQTSNRMCMASLWLVSIGFVMVFSALFSKIWRINKIFGNGMRRVKVTNRDVMLPFIILFSLNFIVLLIWTILSPLTWQRTIKDGTDQFGRPLESYGKCTIQHSHDIVYLSLLLIINISVLLLANFQAYRARSITSEFSEAKYIGIVMASILQACVVGLPVLFLVEEHPPTVFFVRSVILFAICLSTLLLIFLPKMIHLRRWREVVEQRQSLRLERARRSSEFFDRAQMIEASMNLQQNEKTSSHSGAGHEGEQSGALFAEEEQKEQEHESNVGEIVSVTNGNGHLGQEYGLRKRKLGEECELRKKKSARNSI